MSLVIPPTDRTKTELLIFNHNRFRAALVLRGGSVEQIARDAAVSPRHVHYCVDGLRKPSDRLLAVIRAAVGENGWRFAIGQTDTLRDEGGSDGQT